jgi:hypothetical protein
VFIATAELRVRVFTHDAVFVLRMHVPTVAFV